LDGQTNSITKNIGEDWREIEDDRKKNNQGKRRMKIITEEEKTKKEKLGVRE